MIPIDFCVALSGPNVEILWRIFWGTLSRHCNLEGVRFHLINKDAPEHVICNIVESIHCIRTLHNCRFVCDSTILPRSATYKDVDKTCDYMMKWCGGCKWVCISHFDMWFNKDWLTFAREKIADDVAIIGNHCPIMLVNREAYKQTKVKFAVSAPHPQGDTGQALQREMRELGWRVEQSPEINNPIEKVEAEGWFHHIGGGGTQYNEPEYGEKRRLCERKLEELGL